MRIRPSGTGPGGRLPAGRGGTRRRISPWGQRLTSLPRTLRGPPPNPREDFFFFFFSFLSCGFFAEDPFKSPLAMLVWDPTSSHMCPQPVDSCQEDSPFPKVLVASSVTFSRCLRSGQRSQPRPCGLLLLPQPPRTTELWCPRPALAPNSTLEQQGPSGAEEK